MIWSDSILKLRMHNYGFYQGSR